MIETETRTQQQVVEVRRLNMAELQCMLWVASQPVVKRFFDAVKPRYQNLRRKTLLGWFIVIYEAMVMWWWTFLHNLPWPQAFLIVLNVADSYGVAALDMTHRKLEWWWDAAGVRLMWVRESLFIFLDNSLTRIDGFLLRVQDVIIVAFTYVLRPAVSLYRLVVPSTKDAGGLELQPGVHESDLNDDDEDTEFGEDYLSDASTDSRRLLKRGQRGVSYGRQCTTAMAEGRFREAMYHRVKKELRLMRRNSINFSYGVVTYAKQMVGLRVQPYADSFQVSYQKWAREHEIQEMMRPLQEEWSTNRPPIAKILSLAQALCIVCLAFLLRLAKGKKSRRTRSMRSESLRRRTQNLACPSTNQLPISPTALQQSSEPTPSQPLVVPESLQEPALKEDDEYLVGSPAKDSALGSEDTRSDHLDSDHTISTINEGHDFDEVTIAATSDPAPNPPTGTAELKNAARKKSQTVSPVMMKSNGNASPKQKKGVTILTPQREDNEVNKKSNIFNKKVTTMI